MNDGDLMALRSCVLFTYDRRGRMVLTNEPCEQARRPPPRVFLGRTASGSVLRFSAAVPASSARSIAVDIDAAPASDSLRIPPSLLAKWRIALEERSPVTKATGGPAFRFPSAIGARGEAVHLTEANRKLARMTFPSLYDEIADWQPCFVIVRDGVAVSVCFSARLGRAVAEAGVETVPAYRGRGFASAVVAAWGAAVRSSHRIPLYSTDWDNLASQGVARRLGLTMFGTDATLI